MLLMIWRFYCIIQFKESVAQFATENIAPHASKIDHTNYFPQVCMGIYFILSMNKLCVYWTFWNLIMFWSNFRRLTYGKAWENLIFMGLLHQVVLFFSLLRCLHFLLCQKMLFRFVTCWCYLLLWFPFCIFLFPLHIIWWM